jgi:hypothetical protein
VVVENARRTRLHRHTAAALNMTVTGNGTRGGADQKLGANGRFRWVPWHLFDNLASTAAVGKHSAKNLWLNTGIVYTWSCEECVFFPEPAINLPCRSHFQTASPNPVLPRPTPSTCPPTRSCVHQSWLGYQHTTTFFVYKPVSISGITVKITRGSHHMILDLANECTFRLMTLDKDSNLPCQGSQRTCLRFLNQP